MAERVSRAPKARQPDTVAAEVLLRDPTAAKANKVAEYLQQRGVDVSSIGAASLSIRSTRATFERVFQTELAAPNPASDSASGVYDYGGTRRGASEPRGPIVIPGPIAADVESVSLEPSARYL